MANLAVGLLSLCEVYFPRLDFWGVNMLKALQIDEGSQLSLKINVTGLGYTWVILISMLENRGKSFDLGRAIKTIRFPAQPHQDLIPE